MSGADVLIVGAGATNLKSTVAVNLAAALAAGGRAVRLVDGDGASSRALVAALGGAATLPWAAAPITVMPPEALAADGAPPVDDGALAVVDVPPRFDDGVRALVATARRVVVPVDGSPLALRVLGEVEAALGRGGPAAGDASRLRVVLARRLPRAVDRWELVERVGRLGADVLAPITLPMARRASGREALLYAPGTVAARAYAALAARLRAELDTTAAVSTTP